jgi:transposase
MSTTGSTTRPRYPSDLTDRQWDDIATFLTEPPHSGRRRETDLRTVVNAINYRWNTGCAWRMLPHDFPPWTTVYAYYRRWRYDGSLTAIREVLISRPPGGGALSRCA